MWAEEELKTSTLSNGTVENYLQALGRIKQHPISKRKLKTVTAEHLQTFFDLLTFGGKVQYIVLKKKSDDVNLFTEDDEELDDTTPITYEQHLQLMEYLEEKNKPAVLPIQIAYFTGLRLGEVCGLTWQDINLEEQYLTVRRSIRYNGARHKTEIGPTKRKKAKKEQRKQPFQYGELYQRNYYKEVKEKNRVHYELHHLDGTADIPLDYQEISLVCIRLDGAYESPSTLGIVCRTVKERLPGFENFHFHALRHTYTTNLLSNGAQPKDVQELLVILM